MERTEGEEQKTTLIHSLTMCQALGIQRLTGQRSYFEELTKIDINSYYL